MPSKSKKQHNLMVAVANNPQFAKKVGIPQTVGEDYAEADKRMKKYKAGGMHRMSDGTMMKNNAMSCGGKVHMAKGGSVRGCGAARKGLTKGRMV